MDDPRASARPARPSVRVVRTLDDLQRVAAVRALVYMAEQDCPYGEEFDGNDLAGATHLLAEVDGEPAGALRIRWFADFAKIERVCVRPAFRSGRIARALVDEAARIIRRKGYRRFVGQVQDHLVAYWERYGFTRRRHRPAFVFSDRRYVEMEARPAPHPDPLTSESDPLVLDRPEGDWDRPGPLDRSTARGAAPAR